MDKRNKPRTVNNFSDHVSLLSYFFSETYCGGYSGEDPPLPIPNREVKLTIADGTAPPGGRVGSCHALIKASRQMSRSFFRLCQRASQPLSLRDIPFQGNADRSLRSGQASPLARMTRC